MAIVQIVSHVAITVIAVAALALRLEHRLTKIETDVSWLKAWLNDYATSPADPGEEKKGE